MISLVSKPTHQRLGIDIHKFTCWAFSHGMLTGEVWHDSTTNLFNTFVSPNYQVMRSIAEPRPDLSLSLEFDNARMHSIGIGSTLNAGYAKLQIEKLERAYREILKNHGARRRILIDDNQGGGLKLALEESAKDTRYGDAIIQAIMLETLDAFGSNKPLGYRTIVGRIMPAYLKALGFKEYYLSHDLNKSGFDMVRFTLNGFYAFEFYAPYKNGDMPYVERYKFFKGNYVLASSSELTNESLKKEVLEFLVGLAQDLGYFDGKDADHAARETALSVKPNIQPIILEPNTPKQTVLSSKNSLESVVVPFIRR